MTKARISEDELSKEKEGMRDPINRLKVTPAQNGTAQWR